MPFIAFDGPPAESAVVRWHGTSGDLFTRPSEITKRPTEFASWASSSEAKVTLATNCADSLREIRTSDLTRRGKNVAERILESVALIVPPFTDLAAVATDDGGMTIEAEDPVTGRDLLFAIPDDGSVRYFTARERNTFRRAGIVKDEAAIVRLASWLCVPNAQFPMMGLDLG